MPPRVLCLWLPDWPDQRLRSAAVGASVPPEPDPEADLAALEGLAAWCAGRFSPIVAIESPAADRRAGSDRRAPEALLLDVTGIGPLFGGEGALARRVVRELGRRGMRPRVAVADGVGAAWAVARYGPFRPAPTVVAAERQRAVVGRLPVEALRLPDDVVDRLHRLGIDRIASLWELPRGPLATRFGRRLLERLDQASGRLAEPLEAFHAPPSDCAAVDLEYPTGDRAILEHALRGLVDRLAGALAERARGALRLVCRFEAVERPPLEIGIGLFAPSADAAHLGRLVVAGFERRRIDAPVHRLQVAAPLTGPLAQQQNRLLEGEEQPAERRQLARLVDALSGRIGRGSVLQVVPEPDPQPERAYRVVAATGRAAEGKPAPRPAVLRGRAAPQPDDPGGPHPQDPLRRPLELLPEPQPLSVLALLPDGPPVRFRLRGRVYHVARHWGPERIETGWWRGPVVSRDYFRVETDDGQWMWVFRTREAGRWFLHGWFS